MSRHAWIALLVSTAVVLTAFATYVLTTACDGVEQAMNMRAARRHIDATSPAVLGAPGRETITMHVYTGGACGSILVHGTCQTPVDAQILRDQIAQTAPPVEVRFQISCPDPQTGWPAPIEISPINAPE